MLAVAKEGHRDFGARRLLKRAAVRAVAVVGGLGLDDARPKRGRDLLRAAPEPREHELAGRRRAAEAGEQRRRCHLGREEDLDLTAHKPAQKAVEQLLFVVLLWV